MKAILEFELPEDRIEHFQAVLAPDLCAALWDMSNELRTKHKDLTETEFEIYEKLGQRLQDIMNENGIDLDKIYT